MRTINNTHVPLILNAIQIGFVYSLPTFFFFIPSRCFHTWHHSSPYHLPQNNSHLRAISTFVYTTSLNSLYSKSRITWIPPFHPSDTHLSLCLECRVTEIRNHQFVISILHKIWIYEPWIRAVNSSKLQWKQIIFSVMNLFIFYLYIFFLAQLGWNRSLESQQDSIMWWIFRWPNVVMS